MYVTNINQPAATKSGGLYNITKKKLRIKKRRGETEILQ